MQPDARLAGQWLSLRYVQPPWLDGHSTRVGVESQAASTHCSLVDEPAGRRQRSVRIAAGPSVERAAGEVFDGVIARSTEEVAVRPSYRVVPHTPGAGSRTDQAVVPVQGVIAITAPEPQIRTVS